MEAIIRYPGSKWGIANWIISHFPDGYEKMVYLEPFCGSGAVFFNKNPGAVETINDLDSDVVNLFQMLREQPEALKKALELTRTVGKNTKNHMRPARILWKKPGALWCVLPKP